MMLAFGNAIARINCARLPSGGDKVTAAEVAAATGVAGFRSRPATHYHDIRYIAIDKPLGRVRPARPSTRPPSRFAIVERRPRKLRRAATCKRLLPTCGA